MPNTIKLGDRIFQLYIKEEKIQNAIAKVAAEINADYAGKTPLIIPVLNGSFMFASDLCKYLTIACHISFIKASSYRGTTSTGHLTSLIGINEDITGRHIIIVEDIVDSGHTLEKIIPSFEVQMPASLKVATLLSKPHALKADVKIDYVGIEISNEFIVGYGLDYNGLGRNLREIYQVVE